MKKKKKISKIGYLIIALILILISFFIYTSFFNTKKEKRDIKFNRPKMPTITEIKLMALQNIDKKIDFFKNDYLDKYIEYKKLNPNLEIEEIVVNVNIGLDKPFFKDPKESINKHSTTVIANKYYFLGSNYIPKDLTKISSKCSSGNQYLNIEAATAYEELCNAAIKDGLLVKVTSSYRSYGYQSNLYNNYKRNSGEKEADKYSARPGYSEHQTGLAVDVASGTTSFLKFGKTKEFQWMLNNAHRYGFILRYTENYAPITGYISEPWHFRYVGVDIASYIHENPMTYEEYFVRFIDK